MDSPTPDMVRDLRQRYGISQSLLAQMLHVSTRTVERWESPPDSSNHRAIPAGLYELALIKVGESPLSAGYVALTAAVLPTAAPTRRGTPRKRAARVAPAKPVPVDPRPVPRPIIRPEPKPKMSDARRERLRQIAMQANMHSKI